MKVTATLIAVAAATAVVSAAPNAAASSEAEARHLGWRGYCGLPGTFCTKKRSAEAEAEPRHPGWRGYCGMPGMFCTKKRETDNDSDVIGSVIGACGMPGEPCHKMKRAAFAINDILARHAEADATCSSPDSFCEFKRQELGQIAEAALDGYDVVAKREAEDEAKAVITRDDDEEPIDLVHYCDEETSNCARDLTSSPEKRDLVKRCSLCFGGCTAFDKEECKKIAQQKWRAHHRTKASLEAWHKAHPNAGGHKVPHLHPGSSSTCGMPGTFCTKKRDAAPQDVDDTMAPNGVGETLLEIHDAVQAIKREAWGEADIKDPMEKAKHCHKSNCGGLTHAHLYAAKHNHPEAKKYEHFAWGPRGDSARVEPYFQMLERRVNDAVAALA